MGWPRDDAVSKCPGRRRKTERPAGNGSDMAQSCRWRSSRPIVSDGQASPTTRSPRLSRARSRRPGRYDLVLGAPVPSAVVIFGLDATREIIAVDGGFISVSQGRVSILSVKTVHCQAQITVAQAEKELAEAQRILDSGDARATRIESISSAPRHNFAQRKRRSKGRCYTYACDLRTLMHGGLVRHSTRPPPARPESLLMLAGRRRWLDRPGWHLRLQPTATMTTPGVAWLLGVGMLQPGDPGMFFTFFSDLLRPRMVFPRRNVRVLETRLPHPV